MPDLFKTLAGTVGGVLAATAGLAAFTAWNRKHAEQIVPADGSFVDVPGARLHYVDVGEGSPIVMIHGLGGQLRNFTYGVSELLAPHHRLIIVDRPGSGYSTFTGSADQGLASQAGMIADLIDALKLDRPLVVGHSLGGAVSLALALNHPGKASGLALLAPLTQPMDTVPDVFRALDITSPLARSTLAWTLAAPLGRLQADMAGAAIFGPEPVPADFDVRAGAALSLRPEAFLAACVDVASARAEMTGLASRYGELTLPVGIMFATGDRLLDWSEHGPPTVEAIPGAELKTIEGGHMFPLTQPDVTAQWIRERVNA